MDNQKELSEKAIEVSIVSGVEGKCIYLNNLRIAGPKPWGGGTVMFKVKIKIKDIIEAIPELKIKEA